MDHSGGADERFGAVADVFARNVTEFDEFGAAVTGVDGHLRLLAPAFRRRLGPRSLGNDGAGASSASGTTSTASASAASPTG